MKIKEIHKTQMLSSNSMEIINTAANCKKISLLKTGLHHWQVVPGKTKKWYTWLYNGLFLRKIGLQ